MRPGRQAPPALAGGEAHVWLADLDSARDPAIGPLSAGEHARAEAILSPRRRRRWAAARSILRELLGNYLDEDPRRIVLAVAPAGKPELGRSADSLRFNVSHSRGTALYALATGVEVGVDIERLGRPRLRALPGPDAERELLRTWVRREALGKCLGAGLAPARCEEDAPWLHELAVGPGAVAALACAVPVRVRALRWPASPGA